MQSSPSPLCQDQINGNLKVGITGLIRRGVPGRGWDTGPGGICLVQSPFLWLRNSLRSMHRGEG